MFDLLYFTPSSVPFFLAAAFSALLSLYLLTLAKKSSATRWLGLAFLAMTLFYGAYFSSASLFHPATAYYRWITAAMTFCAVVFTTRFFLSFPRETMPRAAKIVLYAQAAFFLLLQIWWMQGTYNTELKYNFAAHSFDLSSDRGGVLGLCVLLSLAGWVVAVFFQTRRLEREERLAAWAMLGAFLVTTVVPTVMYTLNRRGAVANETYHLTFTFFHLIGYFLIAVLYLNTTPDRTTFLAKIVGISLVTLLLYFQWVSFFALRESEAAYDAGQIKDVRRHMDEIYDKSTPQSIRYWAILSNRFNDEQKMEWSLAVPTSMPDPPHDILMEIESDDATGTLYSTAGTKNEVPRLYRGKPGGELFIAYRPFDLEEGEYEFGFRYLDYRRTMHAQVAPLMLLSVVFLLIVLIGFRLFLYAALVRPLNELLSGVREVNEGDLSVELRVRVEDEIGYLTRSFNSMIASIREARQDLEGYANRLEDKVRERTAELRQSLDRISEMKDQQDGDYFLTSLLITPLGTNQAKSDTVAIDFFLKQKKRFKFRHWEDDIGGDICISQSLILRGRPCTVFLNADAMGKSLQGAGGALVLGSVFEAILERSLLSRRERDVFPERWLKNTFIELHKVFESFDGHMLVSLVMGVIDDDTGFLYHINAEHPDLVLFRDGQADFLQPTRTYTKLGMPILRGKIQVDTLALQPGDVLIAGSDGRDDIYLNENPQASNADDSGDTESIATMNEDHILFLRNVEAADGDLGRIATRLENMGALSDDLSLLRVQYHGVAAPPAPAERAALKKELRDLLKDKQYETALAKTLAYLNLDPGENELLYAASVCHKKLRDLSTAADFGERLRLRDPFLVKNLQNLAEIYHQAGREDLTREFLREVLELDPHNQRAQKFKHLL